MRGRTLISAAVVASALSTTTIIAGQAAFNPSWVIQPTPNPAGGTFNELKAVSCSSALVCTAVGSYANGAGVQVTLVERWNGSSWVIQPTPNPAGAIISELLGVSCASDNACTAVGDSIGSASGTLAERWDGSTWVIQPTPNPTGTSGRLTAVSCPSANACTAVGSSSLGTLAERWNGSKWVIQPTPDPAGAQFPVELLGVSCPTATACTAVGDYFIPAIDLGATVTLAEGWNGSRWAIESTPNPAGTAEGSFNTLGGVSCTFARRCTAGGEAGMALALGWNGVGWAIQPTPNPNHLPAMDLRAVSCRVALVVGRTCMAVGDFGGVEIPEVTLAERWNGFRWAIQPTPNPAGAIFSQLLSVSCTSARACTAVGLYFNQANDILTLVERYS